VGGKPEFRGTLDADLKEKQANKAKLQSDVALCTVKLERATQLISGLGGEKTRWTANAGRLGAQYDALTGDTLLAAAFIAYLGAFTAGYRADARLDGAITFGMNAVIVEGTDRMLRTGMAGGATYRF
jgi:hypothetical protein